MTEADRGNRQLEFEITGLGVEVISGDQNVMHFSSFSDVVPNAGPGVEILEKLIGGRVRLLVKPDNTLLRVDGLQELMNRLAADGGGGGGLGLGLVRRVFDAGYFRQMAELSGWPATPVRVGESWSARKDIVAGMVGALVVQTTNTFRGWQQREGRKCARVEFVGTILPKARPKNAPPNPGTFEIEDGKVLGKTWLDPVLGFPVETEMVQSYTVTGDRPNWAARRGGTNAPARDAKSSPPSERFSRPVRQGINVKLKEVQTR